MLIFKLHDYNINNRHSGVAQWSGLVEENLIFSTTPISINISNICFWYNLSSLWNQRTVAQMAERETQDWKVQSPPGSNETLLQNILRICFVNPVVSTIVSGALFARFPTVDYVNTAVAFFFMWGTLSLISKQ